MLTVFFAASDSLLLEEFPEHDESLAGDDLYSLTLNYRWREILVPAITFFFQRDGSDISIENEDRLNNLLNDLYD
jgi:hypothetical protein